jgi:RluA family pseudouridine synthase
MAKPDFIELTKEQRIPILYEDRSVLAIDKPVGWMLAPVSWQSTNRNLQAALLSSIGARDFWARSRGIRFLRYVHRLDAPTSGVMLFARSQGALETFGGLFESRKMEKVYLAVTEKVPKEKEWICRLSIGPEAGEFGRMRIDPSGKPAETEFRLIAESKGRYLIEARPYTGRQHQIRLHLTAGGCPIVGDELYGKKNDKGLGLRAVGLAYQDPFTRRPVAIWAPTQRFLESFGFDRAAYFTESEKTRA